jgi:hypothetical protein
MILFFLSGIVICSGQNEFRNMMNNLNIIKLPLNYDMAYMDHLCNTKATYTKIDDSLFNYFNKGQEGRGFNIKFHNNVSHGIFALGKILMDSNHIFISYLVQSIDSLCSENEIFLIEYDSLGNYYAETTLGELFNCPKWKTYLIGTLNQDWELKIIKKKFKKTDSTNKWIEDTTKPYYLIQFFQNDRFYVSESKGSRYGGEIFNVLPIDSIYYGQFIKFIKEYPELSLPLKFDTAFFLNPKNLVEMDTFSYQHIKFRSAPNIVLSAEREYSLYYIGKRKLKCGGYFCVYLKKYNPKYFSKKIRVQYIIFDENGKNIGMGNVASCDSTKEKMEILDNSEGTP